MAFEFHNYSKTAPETLPNDFTITCPPNTDIWDKPPAKHSFNAPILSRTISVAEFKSARVNISAAWKDKYDQGGLCIVIDPDSEQNKQWVKTGIEFLDGEPNISTVAKDRWADWSLRPMPSHGGVAATIEVAHEADGSLWVYLIEGVQRSPLREVTWWAALEQSAKCWVGVYAAKPHQSEESLEVRFADLLVKTV